MAPKCGRLRLGRSAARQTAVSVCAKQLKCIHLFVPGVSRSNAEIDLYVPHGCSGLSIT